ncbi:hypothetical protein [Roseomonas fluvialis]|uniref:Uncharacterized protein n=1 Tax=Roseomonas fluvialis TaxID=1750527 RepID=A0ABM7Y7E9_9PROT|nr:hypothetical protein [Roseomonas fluvialis]BDG73849.1 hypothetical protein Rmf_37780 [Roseomonas fluvialis]
MAVRSRFTRARGKNHAAAILATVMLALAAPAAPRAQEAAAVAYTQRGVPAEATAENGVIARERAFTAGRRAAWDRIATAAGVTRSLSDQQIESMVNSIIIEEERTSPTRYTGRITVNFNPGRVRAITGSAATAEGTTPAVPGAPGDPPPRPVASTPAAATVEAVAQYGSLNEWLEIRRRLVANTARMEVVAISTDRARLRLGLRAPPAVAAEELARQGLAMVPGSGAPGDAWRVGLAGRS